MLFVRSFHDLILREATGLCVSGWCISTFRALLDATDRGIRPSHRPGASSGRLPWRPGAPDITPKLKHQERIERPVEGFSAVLGSCSTFDSCRSKRLDRRSLRVPSTEPDARCRGPPQKPPRLELLRGPLALQCLVHCLFALGLVHGRE